MFVLGAIAAAALVGAHASAHGQRAAAAPSSPYTATDASISITLVEDVNENGLIDAADGIPARTASILSLFTDEVAGDIVLYTATDGSLSFENIPSGDYALAIAWNGGFMDPAGSDARSHVLEVVFRVEPDGDVVAPSPLPEFWPAPPGTPPRVFDVVADRIVLGRPPSTILLGLKDPDLVAFPTDVEFNAIAVATGSVDVDRAFSSRGLDKPDDVRASADAISWVDRSAGETGYRVTVTVGSTTRTFELAPDANLLQLPPDLRPACGSSLGSTLTAEVVAFTGWSESESASGSRAALCAPPMQTPAVGVTLPNAGTGKAHGSTVPFLLWMGGSILAFSGIAEVARRSLRNNRTSVIRRT